MAEKRFSIPSANPLRFVLQHEVTNTPYWYEHFDDNFSYELIPDFQTKKCYFQKYNISDSPKIQIQSFYSGITAAVFDLNTDQAVKALTVNLEVTTLKNQNFSVYSVVINFSTLPTGDYYVKIAYTDDMTNQVVYLSEPISLKDVHENTILYEYTNSRNEQDIIFKTNPQFIGLLRVEAAIKDFKPKSEDIIYIDQKWNSTTQRSIPYQEFTLWLGSAEGLPDWMVDKVNRVMSFNQVKYDGKYFNKIKGAEFESVRTDDYPFSAQKIQIMPVENKFVDQYEIEINTSDMVVYHDKISYDNVSGQIVIDDVFKNKFFIDKLHVVNRGGDLVINVRNNPDSNDDDGDFSQNYPMIGLVATFDIEQLFAESRTVYVTPTSDGDPIDIDFILSYYDYTRQDTGSLNPEVPVPPSCEILFSPKTEAELNAAFNVGTGLGQPNTPYANYALSDGRNGTRNRLNTTVRGWTVSLPWANLHSQVGQDEIDLTIKQLPPHNFQVRVDVPKSGVKPGGEASGTGYLYTEQKDYSTNTLGEGESINIQPLAIYSLWITKLS